MHLLFMNITNNAVNKIKIIPNLKGIIRVETLGYLKSFGAYYSAFTATRRPLGDFKTFTEAAAAVRAA